MHKGHRPKGTKVLPKLPKGSAFIWQRDRLTDTNKRPVIRLSPMPEAWLTHLRYFPWTKLSPRYCCSTQAIRAQKRDIGLSFDGFQPNAGQCRLSSPQSMSGSLLLLRRGTTLKSARPKRLTQHHGVYPIAHPLALKLFASFVPEYTYPV